MTTLKSINKAIDEGNEDLERLNKNFTKWFELQKKNRLDDLEDRREAKRATKVSATSGAGAATAPASKGGIQFPKLLAGLAAAIAALTAARAIFGDPGTDRNIAKNKLMKPSSRTVRTNAVARAAAKVRAVQLANLKAELAREKAKAKALAKQIARDRLRERLAIRRDRVVPPKPRVIPKFKPKNRFIPTNMFTTPKGPDRALLRGQNQAAKLAAARILAAEKAAAAKREKLRLNRIKMFPGALAEPITQAKNNLAQQRANQRAQIRADAARFRANSNKPTTNFKPFTPGYKPQIMFPNAQQATVQGNLTRMSRPATVTSSTGKVYAVNSPMGQKVITMTQNYQNSIKNQAGNKQMNQKIQSPKVNPLGPLASNITQTKTGGSGGKALPPPPPPTRVQSMRAGLMNSAAKVGGFAMSMTEKFAKTSGAAGRKIMTMASATGNYWKDTKDLIAHRQGANLPRHYKIMLSVGGWLVNKGIAAYIAYKWFYAMTDPMTTWQDKVVISAGLIGALISFKIGAMIGGFIGTFAIATPLVGTIAGGLLGGYLAAKHGQFIAMYIARMLLGMPQPPEVVEDLTLFKAEQKAKIDSVIGKNGGFKMMDSLNAGRAAMLAAPVPLGARPTGQGGLATGGAGEDAASVGSGFNARVPPGQISGIGFAGFGSKQPGENNTNISKGLTGSHFNALGGGISSARKKALAAANIRMMMASGNFGNAINGGTFNTESNNVKLKTVLSNLTATSNALLPHEIKALQAQSNGGGTIIANNDNDNSTTHHHQYGSNGMRTVDTLMAMNGHGGYGVMRLQAATAMGGFSSP